MLGHLADDVLLINLRPDGRTKLPQLECRTCVAFSGTHISRSACPLAY